MVTAINQVGVGSMKIEFCGSQVVAAFFVSFKNKQSRMQTL